ncbi:hypothetical protein F4604DRAFT_1584203 [Suillus subluteus]|nr:hypothetical protein F4604DRAFT_1584203 [Suillus subluteus]
MDDIAEDVCAEQETLLPGGNKGGGIAATSIDAPDFAMLQSTLMEASKGVTEGTDNEYKRLMNLCLSFLIGIHLLGPDKDFFIKKPRPDSPWLIVAWIMNA